jgi:hypothetical protein
MNSHARRRYPAARSHDRPRGRDHGTLGPTQVLFLHPAQLTILELALRVETDLRSCEQDAVERAVRELTRDGLLTCDCRRIAPSRAAARVDELIGGVT